MAKRTEHVTVSLDTRMSHKPQPTVGGHEFLVKLEDADGNKISELFTNVDFAVLVTAVESHKSAWRDKFEELDQEVPSEYRDLKAELASAKREAEGLERQLKQANATVEDYAAHDKHHSEL